MKNLKLELHEQISEIESKDDLAEFVEQLRQDLITNQKGWENVSLDSFLEAMGAWVLSMDRAYKNMGKATPVEPSWSVFADILLSAKMYE